MDHDIDAAKGVDCAIDQGVDRIPVADIGQYGDRLAALGANLRRHLVAKVLRLDRIDYQGAASTGQLLRRRPADIARAAGDNRDLSGQLVA